jgi:hypothetical protein
MRDVDLDLPNLMTELREYPGKGPVTVDTGDTQQDITNKLRMNSLMDGAQIKYKKGHPMFFYRGKGSEGRIPNRFFALALQNLQEYMANTAIYELRRLAGLKTRPYPEWNERFFDMIYDPLGHILPLGAMWTNDEPPEIRQREVTMLVAGEMTLAPNYWNIYNAEAQFVGFAIKLVPRSFTYTANGDKVKLSAVPMKIQDKNHLVEPYIPQLVPIVEDGNRGPCFCSDLDDIAKPGTERYHRELAYEAPRIYQRAPKLNGDDYRQHAIDVGAFNAKNKGNAARPENGIDDQTYYDEMAIHEAPYFRFGQVILTEKPLTTPVRSYSIDPISLSERAILTWDDDIQLQKTSFLRLSICRNPGYEWKR